MAINREMVKVALLSAPLIMYCLKKTGEKYFHRFFYFFVSATVPQVSIEEP
ncbi:hypothetical protein QW060_17375 [Myroides ceti]|uniref:Uncharacterized protein n=1 Tax=Paenimyroides ceti TaxID=395087 RepID=A0ABT8D0V5_9FLAO|nr:hypothetical protein [Paenimyroides ceti]MDN3708864.1 hypothetical protein [Paenimyroides ceti]